jgi:hypothetical protein
VAIFVSGEKKKKKLWQTKKKKEPAIGGGCDPPLVAWGWPRSTPSGLGVVAIHPIGYGERDPATPSCHFCLSGEKKKDSATQTQPKKLFIMPQKLIIMS